MGVLIQLLKTEEFAHKSQVQMKRFRAYYLMYMAMDQREANLFFPMFNHLYEQSSIILTSNKSPDQWGELMGDEGITTRLF